MFDQEFKINGPNLKRTTLTILGGLIWTVTFAQIDMKMTDTTTSIYKGLVTKRFYDVSYYVSSGNGVAVYEINNKTVSKSEYEKYHYTWKNMETCQPCILETYDINNKLLSKGIFYTDCPVGFLIEYFPNGKVKLIAHYKENESEDWKNLSDRGFCSEDGAFTYFNDRGQKLYSEYWKDGQFIKQIPEQPKTEIWNVALTIDNVKVGKQILTPNQVSQIKVSPQFKNSSTAGTNIIIEFEISAEGFIPNSRTFKIENFKTINVQKMLDEIGIKSPKLASYTMYILNNGVKIFHYSLNVKP